MSSSRRFNAALGWVLGLVCMFSSARAGTLGLPGQAEIERSVLNEGNLSRLEAAFDKATKGGTVSIAALGGSITEGTGSYELSNRWSAHVADWFETTFPNATILRTNAGIGATGSRLGCHRIARDIQPANPDLVLVDFSVNDHAGENGGETMEGCVRQLLRLASNPAVLLVSMLRQDGSNVQDEHLSVSRYYALSHLSVRDAVWPRIAGGEIAWSDYSGDAVHPNRDGHPYIAALVTAYLERCLKNWKDGASSAAYVFPTKPLFGTTYDSGAVVRARDLRLSANKGFVPGTDRQGTKWNGVMVGSKPGDRMAFTTDAATLTLVYWKLHADFGRVRVTVDGKPLKTLDGWFSETWGGKAETCELFRDKPGQHEVEIEILNEKSAESNGNQFEICAILEQQATVRSATTAMGFSGKTYHVAMSGNDATYDGLSPFPTTTPGAGGKLLGPKRTVQAALNAAVSGDVVSVGEGVYEGVADFWLGATVAYLDKKRIYLRGAGKGKTVIRGSKGTTAGRCLTIHGADSNGTLVEGITFRDGETDADVQDSYQRGGGVYGNNSLTYFVDCAFKNCCANKEGGALYGAGAVLVRCLFDGNVSKCQDGGSAIFGQQLINGAYNCIFIRNGDPSYLNSVLNVCTPPGSGSTGSPFVNCTFVGNSTGAIPSQSYDAQYYNCIFTCHPSKALTRSSITAYYCGTDSYGTIASGNGSNFNASEASFTNFDYQVFSPATGDFRLTGDSCAVGSGNAEYCAISGGSAKLGFLPEEYLDTDYLGLPRFTAGRVSRGAVETPASVNSSAPALVKKPMKINGVLVDAVSVDLGLWVRTENYPAAARLEPADSSVPLYCFISSANSARFPDLQGGVWHVFEPVSTLTIAKPSGFWSKWVTGLNNLTTIDAAGIKWADSKLADYSQANGSEEHPYKTIQEAVDAAPNFGIVKVKRGTYAEGGVQDCHGASARVAVTDKSVRIEGVEGCEKTILKGAFHSDGQKTGANACRGFCLLNVTSGAYCGVGGFTITGCAGPAFETVGASSEALDYAGAAVMASVTSATFVRNQVYDCIISNNYAYSSPALFSGWAQRCVIADNHQEVLPGVNSVRGAACRYATLSSCLLYGNAKNGYVASVGHKSMAFNCTIHEGTSIRSMDDSSKVRVNTIFYGSNTGNPESDGAYAAGCICYEDANLKSSKNWMTVVDPLFADPAAHDYRVASLSPALSIGALGNNEYSYSKYAVGSLEGLPLAVDEGGAIMAGCCGETVASCDAGESGLTPSGIVMVDQDGQVTVTAADPRPLAGFLVNGQTVPATGSGRSYTWIATDPAYDRATIRAIYGTDWYVSPSGNDGNTGYTKDEPKKTLRGIMLAEGLQSGDTVHAAAGDYREGEMTNEVGNINNADVDRLPSRVVVKGGVTLIADEGPGTATIWGRWHSETERQGDNALRAVYLYANAVLDGFVVRDGSTRVKGGGVYEVNAGGCVCAPKAFPGAATAIIRNCEIFNGGARSAAGVYGGVIDHCHLHDHVTTSDTSSAMYSRLEHTVIDNSSRTAVALHCGIYSSVIYSSTSINNVQELTLGASGAGIENSIIVVPNGNGAVTPIKNMHHCIFSTGKCFELDPATCSDIIESATLEGVLDSDFRPVAGSPAIDEGSNELLEAHFGSDVTDLTGGQRIYNATVDIGAVEFDWRAQYAKDIGTRLTVVSASPEVEETDGGVTLTDASALDVVWRTEGKSCLMNVSLTGGGALTVRKANGEVVVRYAEDVSGPQSCKLNATGGSEELIFDYVGEGAATLTKFSRLSGLFMVVR